MHTSSLVDPPRTFPPPSPPFVIYSGGVIQEENVKTFEHVGMNKIGFVFKNVSLKDVNLGFHL